MTTQQNPPDLKKIDHKIQLHGESWNDPYFWLREKENPNVISYLNNENKYTEESLKNINEDISSLYEEMLGRIQEDDQSVPYPYGEWFYSLKTEEGKPYPIYMRTPQQSCCNHPHHSECITNTLDSPAQHHIHCDHPHHSECSTSSKNKQIVLDINLIANDHEYTNVSKIEVSPDHSKVAYLVDHSGYERSDLYVLDIKTREIIDKSIKGISSWGLVWANDNKTLFYETLDSTNRPNKVVKHILGDPQKKDIIVATENDPKFWISVGKSRSEQLIWISTGSGESSEWQILDANNPNGKFTLISKREPKHEYSIEESNGIIYILTNKNALNFKIMTAPIGSPEIWSPFITHDPSIYITSIDAFENHLVLTQRVDGYQKLKSIDLRNKKAHMIAAKDPVSTLEIAVNKEFKTNTLRYTFESLTSPEETLECNLDGIGPPTLLKTKPVKGGHDSSKYNSWRTEAISHDGTKVPISVVARADVTPNSSSPCVLYGYGSYGSTMDPYFSTARLSFLDRGVIWAIAHIRGGGEMGRSWYNNAKYEKKPNTFHDFIASAEHLIKEGWTTPDQLAIAGGSAGGLLMGAVLNMRPELFKAALAQVPFVDVLNTMMDPSIPLTVNEYEEWGNPSDKNIFDVMRSYSPYDNVKKQKYPAILITAGLNDPRVHYWEAAKWCAKLRDMSTSDKSLLLKTNMGAGHGGASGRYGRLKEVATEYGFLLNQLNVLK